MLSVLFKLLVMQPHLLLTHANNYAALLREDTQRILISWRLRFFLCTMSAALFGIGVLSSAVALLLWGALPALNSDHAWVLVALPALFFLMSALFYWALKRQKITPLFEDIQEQITLDSLTIFQAYRK